MEDAFEDHFVELWGTGFRVAYRLSGNRADAEDMTADTLADALRGWGRIREPTGWVARVVARRTLRLVKSRRWLRPEAELPDVADNTELLRWELAQVMQQLPRRQREVVALRFLADLPERAVAETLGISLSSVKTHSSRARATLRQQLMEPFESDQTRCAAQQPEH